MEFVSVEPLWRYMPFGGILILCRNLYSCLSCVLGLLKPPYWSSYSKPRLWLHTVVSSKYFDLGIAAVIGVNVVTMAIEHYNMPKVISAFILYIQIYILDACN